MKTLEEYFQEREFAPDGSAGEELSAAEKAFLQKYLGVEGKDALRGTGIDVPDEALEEEGIAAAVAKEPSLEEQLKVQPELQLVSFFVQGQEFTIPINVVQEVIRFQQPTRLPLAPAFIPGVINLRGRVTPLVSLRYFLHGKSGEAARDDFIIVCSRKGLQMGLVISTVHTMYRVRQDMIDWGIESTLGANAELVSGLLQSDDRLVGILSVDRIVDTILKL
ncbi:MAG: chemotaxis protein CheW [Desulfovibrionaceae bacterium]